MFCITRKVGASFLDGFVQVDVTYEKALEELRNFSVDDWSPLVLWWIHGDRNDRVAEANKGHVTWAKDRYDICEHGFHDGGYKCPLCGTMIEATNNIHTVAAQHIHTHFA